MARVSCQEIIRQRPLYASVGRPNKIALVMVLSTLFLNHKPARIDLQKKVLNLLKLLPLEAYGEYAAECSDSESSGSENLDLESPECLPSPVSPTLYLKRSANADLDESDGQPTAKRVCQSPQDHECSRAASCVAKPLPSASARLNADKIGSRPSFAR